jgi:hypothetical protein
MAVIVLQCHLICHHSRLFFSLDDNRIFSAFCKFNDVDIRNITFE